MTPFDMLGLISDFSGVIAAAFAGGAWVYARATRNQVRAEAHRFFIWAGWKEVGQSLGDYNFHPVAVNSLIEEGHLLHLFSRSEVRRGGDGTWARFFDWIAPFTNAPFGAVIGTIEDEFWGERIVFIKSQEGGETIAQAVPVR